jgi:tetratricopeptide (TPR) repeat protein
MLRLHGALSEAESEARRAAEELGDFLTDVAGGAFYEIGEVRLRMGDLSGAEAMFAEAHARGRDPQPGLAQLRLAQEKSAAARAMIERALIELGLTPLDRARLLPAVVEIRLACGDVNGAADAAAELATITRTYPSPALTAWAALALGRVELARARTEQAMVQLRRACRIWGDLELPIELAQTRLLLSRAYAAMGNVEEAAREQRTAHATMQRVGAGTVRTPAPEPNPAPTA